MIQSKKLLMNDNVTLTVVTTPATATCTLTYNSVQYSTKTLTVPKGSTISYSVYYSTYGTTTGSITMDKDKTLTCTGTSGTSYTDVSWSNPNLSSNGSLGGSSFAVQASGERGTSAAWKAFDGSTTTFWISGSAATTSAYMIMYNPNAIKLSTISITNYTSNAGAHTPTSGTIYGSSNNSSWSTIKSYTNSTTSNKGNWSISVNSSSYYKYWKINMSKTNTSGNMALTEISMSGYYQSSSTTYYWNTSTT